MEPKEPKPLFAVFRRVRDSTLNKFILAPVYEYHNTNEYTDPNLTSPSPIPEPYSGYSHTTWLPSWPGQKNPELHDKLKSPERRPLPSPRGTQFKRDKNNTFGNVTTHEEKISAPQLEVGQASSGKTSFVIKASLNAIVEANVETGPRHLKLIDNFVVSKPPRPPREMVSATDKENNFFENGYKASKEDPDYDYTV